MNIRKPVFDALRAIKGHLTQKDVEVMDDALDKLGVGEKHISDLGIAVTKEFEGCELHAYKDSVGVSTIGYGHTHGVQMGQTITQAQADEFLREDIQDAEQAVTQYCPVTTQGQFDALVDFTFNLGEGSLRTSTLRRKHNEGDYAGAAEEFGKWVFAGGKKLDGLVKRRAAEARLYRGIA